MRAIFAEDLFDQLNTEEIIEYKGKKCHHLLNVARVKVNEELLVLNGKGGGHLAEVCEIQKRSIKLRPVSLKTQVADDHLELAVCRLKKDALSLVLKMAVELGVSKIYILQSDYSNKEKITLSDEKMQKLLENAVEQSNNFHLPQIVSGKSVKDVLSLDFSRFCVLHPGVHKVNSSNASAKSGKTLLLIGPEGGFSNEEVDLFKSANRVDFISRPGPIMRAPTAVAWAIGHLERDG